MPKGIITPKAKPSVSCQALFLMIAALTCFVIGAYAIYGGYVLDTYENQLKTVREEKCDEECKKTLQENSRASGVWRVTAPMVLIFAVFLLAFSIKLAFFKNRKCLGVSNEDDENSDAESTVPVRDLVWVKISVL